MAFKMTKIACGNFGSERRIAEIWAGLFLFSDERYVAAPVFF